MLVDRLINCAIDLIPGIPGTAIIECVKVIKNTHFTTASIDSLDDDGRPRQGAVVGSMASFTGLALDTYECLKTVAVQQLDLEDVAKKIPGLSESLDGQKSWAHVFSWVSLPNVSLI